MSTVEIAKNVRGRLATYKEHRIGTVKKQALLILLGGLSLSLSGSPRTSWKILGALIKEWRELGRQSAERVVNSLYASKLVEVKENANGTLTLVLSEKGRQRALTYDIVRMKIQTPPRWDNRWRIVSFDIPEDEKAARDSFREHLFRLGFYELHRSVFIHPFDCLEELLYIAGLYGVGTYIHFILAVHVDNEAKLKRFFGLSSQNS